MIETIKKIINFKFRIQKTFLFKSIFLHSPLCILLFSFSGAAEASKAPHPQGVEQLINVMQADQGLNIKAFNNSRVMKCIGGNLVKTYSAQNKNLHELRQYWPTDWVYTMIHGLSDSPMTLYELAKVMCQSKRSMSIVLIRLHKHGLQTPSRKKDGYQLQWARYRTWVQQIKNTLIGSKNLGRQRAHLAFSMGALSSTLAIAELSELQKPNKVIFIEPFLSTHGQGTLAKFLSFAQKIPLFPIDELLFRIQSNKKAKGRENSYPNRYRVISPNGYAQSFKQASFLRRLLKRSEHSLLGENTQLLIFRSTAADAIKAEDIQTAQSLVPANQSFVHTIDSQLVTHSRMAYPLERIKNLTPAEQAKLWDNFYFIINESRKFLGIN